MTYQDCRTRSAGSVSWSSHTLRSFSEPPTLLKRLWRDPLLLGAFLLAGLLIAFQLGVLLVQPSWKVAVTDWLRAVLAWLELLVPILISLWLTRMRRQEARAWWMISAGLLTYAIAQTLWVIFDQFVSPGHVPVPWWPDLFFLLQYPCFFLALTFLPGVPPWDQPTMSRVKVVLDSLLVMAALTALSWYFLLEPLYLHSGQPWLGKATNLAYPVGDLGILFGLILALLRRCRFAPVVFGILIVAIACLATADSWFTFIDLSSPYLPGSGLPDLFWMACYLLFPLAGLWQLRLVQTESSATPQKRAEEPHGEWMLGREVVGSFRFLLPFVAALLAGGLIMVRASLIPIGLKNPLIPFAISFGLLLLVTARQEITFLESERWRREREVARTNELLAMQEANQYMDTFLGMAGHELKTPLTSIKLALQLAERRIQRLTQRETAIAATIVPFQEQVGRAQHQTERLERLVNDLLDVSRVRAGQLDLHPSPTDLAAILSEVVEEQRQAAPERTLVLQLPTEQIRLVADADRIGQVVTNYLTNAIKYSPPDCPVIVGLHVEAQQVRVWVRDEGPGLPAEEQERIWERFHRVKGINVQSGTGVGLGLGLHICQTIIERHQGQVGVESMPGEGATFWFTLPL